ncbi:MAG: peptidyl-tRNA hydrolase [Theionarchaea archaeon]|nr:peptidyl-tRNA hydrolase [Theionarchaea archaeon]
MQYLYNQQTYRSVFKQVIVVRTDLKLGKGKLAAQVAHASLEAYVRAPQKDQKAWIEENQKKVVLKVKSEYDLVIIFDRAKRAGLPTTLIQDAGLTQIPPGTKTAVGIGPARAEEIDVITGNLSLL